MDWDKIEKAINESGSDVKNLLFSAEVGDELQKIAELNNLGEEQSLKLADEVTLILLGLKPKTSFVDSLVRLGINKDVATLIEKEVELKIFSKLDKNKNQQKQEPPKEENIKSYDSFEQTILRQAQAMRVAQAPNNLPGSPVGATPEGATPTQSPPQQHPVSNDPYREPVE